MLWIHLLADFFAGLFLANAIPHVVSGMLGQPFQSPFAKPHGVGLSSSTVNVLWGGANVVAGYLLAFHGGDLARNDTAGVVVFALGALAIALFSARHFGRFHGGNQPTQS